jgi:hypothetical protein
MVQYVSAGAAGAASTTSATAGIIAIYQPASATMAGSRINQMMLGPGANSADNTYSVRLRRETTASTYGTAVTPACTGPTASTATALSGVNTSARGTITAGSQGYWGFHMRGGMAWTAIPGGEQQLLYVFSAGLILEYFFAQGTDTMEATLMFSE